MNRLMKYYAAALCVLAAVLMLAGCGKDTGGSAGEAAGDAPNFDRPSLMQNGELPTFFSDEPVDQKDAEAILASGMNTVGEANEAGWSMILVTDAEILAQFSGAMPGGMGFGGPRGDSGEGWTRPEDGEFPEGMDRDWPENMTFPEGEWGERPEGMTPPEGFTPDGTMPEGMDFPEGFTPGGNMFGRNSAPLAIVISCKAGYEQDIMPVCNNMSETARQLGYAVQQRTLAMNRTDGALYRELLEIPEEFTPAAVISVGREDTEAMNGFGEFFGGNSGEE